MPQASCGLQSCRGKRCPILPVALAIGLLAPAALWAQGGGEPPSNLVHPEAWDGEKGERPLQISRPSNLRTLLAPGGDSSGLARGHTLVGGWWLGPAGITAALAACGAACIAARKYWPQQDSGPVRVVGRVSLSPKHAIYLVRAGQRTLLVGTGSQGAPSLLGALDEDGAIEELTRDAAGLQISGRHSESRINVRLGEEE